MVTLLQEVTSIYSINVLFILKARIEFGNHFDIQI